MRLVNLSLGSRYDFIFRGRGKNLSRDFGKDYELVLVWSFGYGRSTERVNGLVVWSAMANPYIGAGRFSALKCNDLTY